jgi:hypothetical protein
LLKFAGTGTNFFSFREGLTNAGLAGTILARIGAIGIRTTFISADAFGRAGLIFLAVAIAGAGLYLGLFRRLFGWCLGFAV